MCGVDTDGGREGGRVRSETAATHGEVRERENVTSPPRGLHYTDWLRGRHGLSSCPLQSMIVM